jgi:hypothetical protein
MYRQARDRQSARGAANMLHDPYVNNAIPRSAFGRACIEQRALYVTTEPRGRIT